jgi:hypothetical protein
VAHRTPAVVPLTLYHGSKEPPPSSNRAKSTVPVCCCTIRIQPAESPGGSTT